MNEELIAFFLAACALGALLVSWRRAREKITALEGDVDAVEAHNRTLQEAREALKTSLAEASAALETTTAEKRDLEKRRAALAETAARLEKARTDLEADLGKLRREHESLEHRVVGFQGQWSHQLSTLEAEISTLIRQLGEFRKGTVLPIPSAEASSPAPTPEVVGSSSGSRLAGTRPRPISSEPSADPSAVRRLP